MSEQVVFFSLIADSVLFDDAFNKAKEKALEFAAGYKAMRASVESDSLAVEAAQRRVSAGAVVRGAGAGRGATGLTGGIPASAAGAEAAAGGATAGEASAGGLAGTALTGSLFAVLALTAAGAGLLGILEHLTAGTAEQSATILRNSQAIGIDTTSYQVWSAAAKATGVDQETLTRGLEIFTKQLYEGAPTLKAAGVDLAQLGITAKDPATALNQLSDYLHNTTDEGQKFAVVQALMGRGGLALLPMLQQGSAAVKSYGDELARFGIILDTSQLTMGAAANVVHSQFMLALQGAESQITQRLEPAFIQLWTVITNLTVNGKSAFAAFGDVVANVVSFIAGLIEQLTGTHIDLTQSINSAGSAFEGMGGNAQNAGAGIDGATGASKQATAALDALKLATKEQTDAITNQVEALTNEKRAYDEATQAQLDGLNDQLAAITNVTDHQRRQGEDIVSYRRRMAEDDLKTQIQTLGEQKTAKDQAYQDQITALNQQKADLQQHLADEQAAVSDAAANMAADFGGAFGSATTAGQGMAVDVNRALGTIDTKVADTGARVAKTLQGIFSDPQGAEVGAAKALGTALGTAFTTGINNSINLRTMDFFLVLSDFSVDAAKLGKLLNDFSTGNWLALPGDAAELANALGMMGDNAPAPTPGNGTLGSYAAGGVITSDQLARLHRNEVVIPLTDSRRALQLMSQTGLDRAAVRANPEPASAAPSPSSNSFIYNNYGPIADAIVAERVVRRLAKQANRTGLLNRAGIG